jgi:hypothetical protein
VTEVIIGVLRAYDISIARGVEEFIRSHQSSSGYRPRISSRGMPSDERIVFTGQSDSGILQVGKRGYFTRTPGQTDTIWTPSINMWAATGNEATPTIGDLTVARCGYPKDSSVTHQRGGPNGGYTTVTQRFERGTTRITEDPSKGPGTIQNIYERNKGEEVWLPA